MVARERDSSPPVLARRQKMQIATISYCSHCFSDRCARLCRPTPYPSGGPSSYYHIWIRTRGRTLEGKLRYEHFAVVKKKVKCYFLLVCGVYWSENSELIDISVNCSTLIIDITTIITISLKYALDYKANTLIRYLQKCHFKS